MLQFDEYRVKLNNLKPDLDELRKALDLDSAERELDELHAQSAADGFWDNVEKAPARSNGIRFICLPLLYSCSAAIEVSSDSSGWENSPSTIIAAASSPIGTFIFQSGSCTPSSCPSGTGWKARTTTVSI